MGAVVLAKILTGSSKGQATGAETAAFGPEMEKAMPGQGPTGARRRR